MDIHEFLHLCVGDWFSQRSSYHFEQQQGASDKSELSITWLTPDDPEVHPFCQPYPLEGYYCLGAQKVSWNTGIDWGKTKKIGSSLLVFAANRENPAKGQLICSSVSHLGAYELGSDDSLTLTLEEPNQSIVERIWFASPNLRLRTSIIRQPQGFNRTAFYSEIRKLPPKS